MTLLVAAAFAHVPHDPVIALAPSWDDDAPWWLVADPQGVTLLLRSDDAGATWSFAGGAPLAESLVAATRLDDGTVVLVGEERYWWTHGAGWEEAELPGEVSFAAGGSALSLAGGAGLWTVTASGAERVFEDRVLALAPGVAATTDDVWFDGAWLGSPGEVTALTTDGERLWAGTAAGEVFRWDGAWEACGELGATEHPDIVALATDGLSIALTTGDRAVVLSLDGCESWTERPTGDTPIWAGDAVTRAAAAWPVLAVSGERIVAGGWDGLFTSEDAGRTWTDPPLVGPDHTRGLAMESDGVVWVGGYGAGVLRTDDGGASFTAPNHGLGASNVQRVVTSNRLYAVAGHDGYVSDDGESWEPWRESLTEVLPWCDGSAWVIDEAGDIAAWDGAWDWPDVPLDGRAVGAADIGRWRCVGGRAPSQVLCDGDSWYEGSSAEAVGPVAWPSGDPDRLLFGDADGVHVLTATEARTTWSRRDAPVQIVAADDGTVLVATRSGRLLRSDDGGETFTASDWRLTATPNVMVARPAFATHPDVLVGTHDGTWLVSGDAPPVRWAAYGRVDDASTFFERTALPDAESDADADLDGVQPLVVGGEMAAWVRGATITVRGQGSGSGEVEVDGVVTTFGGREDLGELETVTVTDGWHRLVLRGDGVSVDGVEVWGEGAVLEGVGDGAVPGPGPCDAPAPCGCGGSGAAWVIVGICGVGRRRPHPSHHPQATPGDANSNAWVAPS